MNLAREGLRMRSRLLSAGLRPVLVVSLGLAGSAPAEDVPSRPGRIPWTNSRVIGTPEPPPPYTIEPAFPGLTFERPLLLATYPGSRRMVVGEQAGKIFSFPVDGPSNRTDLAIDLSRRKPACSALYGLAFHPRFQDNREVFVCYVSQDNTPDGTRVSRFRATSAEPLKLDPDSEQRILTWPSGGHNGGCLAFGPDGYLYISTGDAEVPSPPDPRDTGQDLSDLLSSVLRIDVDHADPGKSYRVPADNPFVKLAGARPEIWAYGFRNPWKMSFDRVKGDLWLGDVGWELWELVDRVERGGNYGWSVVEGTQPVHPDGRRGPTPILPPTTAHPHSEAASITGGFVYRGKKYPDLVGTYVYGDFQSGKVWGLRHDGQKVTWRGLLAETPLQLVSFGEDADGELYLLDYERSRQLHRLVPNRAAAGTASDFPRGLSQTGLFTSTKDQTPAPGVIPYAINAALWSDHAVGDRLLALPGASRIKFGEKGEWRLPEGSVLARTVSLEREKGNPASKIRLETQILHLEAESWRPYTYVWNDEQTDATLADADGTSRTIEVVDRDAPGGRRTQNYRVHSRAECTLCHNPWVEKKTTVFGRQSASPLGLNTAQLNRKVGTRDQLGELTRMGLFETSLPRTPARTVDPYDETADLGKRARAYLQVNCSHCHQFNAGGTATIWLSEDMPLDKTQVLGVRPGQGAFGIDDARIVNPGDPAGSVLFYRLAKLGGGRMPRVGSSVVDEQGLRMLGEWIASLDPRSGAVEPSKLTGPGSSEGRQALDSLRRDRSLSKSDRERAVETLLGSTRGALSLVHAIDTGLIARDLRDEIAARASGQARVEVRDLFERYLPDSRRVARLGEAVDPRTILERKGDARRGRELFVSGTTAQCKTCHRLEGVGDPLGPDLAKVGSKYPRTELLDQILFPSRSIDPNYATVVVETKDGHLFTGLVASRDASGIVLKDAQARATKIAANEVEHVTPQSRSLMPELLLRDLTAQQAADLLDYLGSLKQ